MCALPKKIKKIIVPPIKCQGIKTKLIPFISSNISWRGEGKWIEPFLGSGVVGFNIAPERALFADTNRHIINFYSRLQSKKIDHIIIREKLEFMGERLAVKGEDYFYDIRERFNRRENSIYFLFLNRSCFNGLMRFNGSGKFNVPFGKKPKRFSKSYITKIVNQADRLSKVMADKDWTFIEADWRVTLEKADPNDFVYLDPPYVGRNADYFNKWHEQDAIDLSIASIDLPCKYALSMWLENKYRKNIHLDKYWSQTQIKTFDHFYHVGSSESLRNEMKEALALSKSRRRARQFVQ